MNIIDGQITFCGVSDLDRTALFWERCMGLRMVLDQGTCHIYNTIGQAYLRFCQRDHVVAGEQVILTIVADEVDTGTTDSPPPASDRAAPPTIRTMASVTSSPRSRWLSSRDTAIPRSGLECSPRPVESPMGLQPCTE